MPSTIKLSSATAISTQSSITEEFSSLHLTIVHGQCDLKTEVFVIFDSTGSTTLFEQEQVPSVSASWLFPEVYYTL